MQSGAGGGGGGGAAAAAAAAAGGDYNDVTAARRGRFRVTSSTPTGPPETTLGRFRLMPTCKCTPSPPLSLTPFSVNPFQLLTLFTFSFLLQPIMAPSHPFCSAVALPSFRRSRRRARRRSVRRHLVAPHSVAPPRQNGILILSR